MINGDIMINARITINTKFYKESRNKLINNLVVDRQSIINNQKLITNN